MSRDVRKPVFRGSDQVRHKPGCTAEGLYYPSGENKDADQLRGHREADLRLYFRICKNPVFSRRGSNDSYIWSQTSLSVNTKLVW